jgi:hypothetical protein
MPPSIRSRRALDRAAECAYHLSHSLLAASPQRKARVLLGTSPLCDSQTEKANGETHSSPFSRSQLLPFILSLCASMSWSSNPDYEDLTRTPESVIRRIILACGLA